MFLTNRFQGYDYVLPGARADIGLSAFTNSKISLGFAGVSRRHGEAPWFAAGDLSTVSAEKKIFYGPEKTSAKFSILNNKGLTQNYFASADGDLEEATVSVSQSLNNNINLRASQNWDLSNLVINRPLLFL